MPRHLLVWPKSMRRFQSVPGLWLQRPAQEPGKFQRLEGDPEREFCGQEYCLTFQDGHLAFEASGSGLASQARGKSGEFTMELWKGEVAELFLVHPESGRYLEINLSPTGAWWACLFEKPRESLQPGGWQPEGVRTVAGRAEACWFAAIYLPLAPLCKALSVHELGKLRGNITFIRREPEMHLFASVAALPGAVPDFHQPAAFLNIEVGHT